MTTSAEQLVLTTRGMLARTDLDEAIGEPGFAAEEAWGDASEVEGLAEIFEVSFGFKCPVAFRDALLLPDQVTLRWAAENVAGEYDIANPLIALERKVDASLAAQSIQGMNLSDFCIVDRVLAKAGPLFVGFEVGGKGDLYLYDTRELRILDIDLNEYLGWAAALRGLIFWQFLFAKGRLTPDKASALATGLQWLEHEVAGDSLLAARKRFDGRS